MTHFCMYVLTDDSRTPLKCGTCWYIHKITKSLKGLDWKGYLLHSPLGRDIFNTGFHVPWPGSDQIALSWDGLDNSVFLPRWVLFLWRSENLHYYLHCSLSVHRSANILLKIQSVAESQGQKEYMEKGVRTESTSFMLKMFCCPA